MANVWAGDPNIISVWNFESGALNTDSGGAGNTLTPVNTPQEDVVDYKQGTCCTSLAFASKRFFKITDASLSAGFPLKSGDTVQRITMGCWFKLASTGGNVPNIIGKNTYAGAGLALYHNAGSLRIAWNATANTLLTISTGVWYHCVLMADGRARTLWARLYASDTGTTTNYIFTPPAADLTLTSEWRIGAWSGTDADRTFDGKIDEVFVFSRLLSAREIDLIRNGSYSYSAASTVSANDYTRDLSCLSVYHLESGALTTDAKALINLTASASPPVVNTVDFKVGSGCAQFAYRDSTYYAITDANLPVNWPMKSGYGNRTLTICCWIKGFDYGPAASRFIVGKWLASNYNFAIYISSTTQTFSLGVGYTSGGTSTSTFSTGIPFLPGEWYHVSVALDCYYKKVMHYRIYQDSTGTVNAGTWNHGQLVTQGTADFRIGTNQDGATNYWNGLIDEFVVFNRILCLEEMDAVRSGTYKGPISSDTPNYAHIPALLTFAQAVNCPRLTFNTGGNSNWGIENNETHDGGFSGKSGTISLNQESWFSTTVNGPGTLTFWWAIDSTADHHYLEFQIDGAAQHSISGPNNPGAWALKTYPITSGPHTLKWRYYTDGTATTNRNTGWVDEISFGYANDFTGDSSCKALYKFENSSSLGYDSIGTNHLRDNSGVDFSSTRFKEGFQCANFYRTNVQYFSIDDGLLGAGFPLKNSDTTRTGTWCCWVNFRTLSGSTYYDIITKGSTTNRALDLNYYNGLCINWGYSGSNQQITLTGALSTNRWYHISVAFDGVNKRLFLRLWDDELQQIVCDQAYTVTNAMIATADSFSLGNYPGGGNTFEGLLDEVVIFNRQLPTWQMDAVRKGVFSGTGPTQPGNDFSSDSTCKALWKFEAGALTTDSKSTNTLTDHSTVSITNVADTVKEGSGCVKTANSAATWLHIADGSLAAGFPLKNGDANKIISVCLWFRPIDFGNFRNIIAKRAGSAKGSFLVYCTSTNLLYISYVYGSGAAQDFQIGVSMSTYSWYHLGFTIDGINKKITWRLYNSYTETSTYGEFYPGAELRIENIDWTIGCEQGASTGTSSNAFYGYIDEVVVFNRLLNILEIDAIRQGKYSGTGIEGIAVDHISAQVAYRTSDRQSYFCVDPDVGTGDVLNDGLSYSRPWRTHKGKFLAPGDTVTFPSSTKYAQVGTSTVTVGSLTVNTSQNLMGTLNVTDIISFGSDTVMYTIKAITSSSITLYRPYRGSTRSTTLYKIPGFKFDWLSWNSGNYYGYPDQRIKLLCGVNRTTGVQDGGFSLFDFQSSYGTIDTQPFIYYSKLGIFNAGTSTTVLSGKGLLLEDFYFGDANGQALSLSSFYQSTFTRSVLEGYTYLSLDSMTDNVFNDLEMFVSHASNLSLGSLKNITFNRYRTGNSVNGLYLVGSLRDVVFYNPVFDEGTAHTCELYMYANAQYFIDNLSLVNASLNISTPKFFVYYATTNVIGEVSYAHYNQTLNDHRTYIFNGSPTASYAGIMYRDTSTFRTSSPSCRIDFTGGIQLPITRKFFVPAAAGVNTTISVYVMFNSAYMSNNYLLPSMTVRTVSGTSPNLVWGDSIVSAAATPNAWLLLTQTVAPSIDSIVEVYLNFQSVSSSAQVWFDEFDVVVPE